MKAKKSSLLYRMLKWLIWVFYPKTTVVGAENLPNEAAIVVGNHSQLNGPIACELYFPTKCYTWCAGQMMKLQEVPSYAFKDFWSHKPAYSRWLYKLLAYIIAPFSVCIFNNANTIAVYHDSRLFSTFKRTVTLLQEGSRIVIFPEHDVPHNHIVNEFQEKFVDVAKLYYKKTNKELCFVPLYIAPRLKTMYIGKPLRFCATNPIEQERKRICQYLMNEITEIAQALPSHTVIPYRNIPRRYYPSNIPREVDKNEKTSR